MPIKMVHFGCFSHFLLLVPIKKSKLNETFHTMTGPKNCVLISILYKHLLLAYCNCKLLILNPTQSSSFKFRSSSMWRPSSLKIDLFYSPPKVDFFRYIFTVPIVFVTLTTERERSGSVVECRRSVGSNLTIALSKTHFS